MLKKRKLELNSRCFQIKRVEVIVLGYNENGGDSQGSTRVCAQVKVSEAEFDNFLTKPDKMKPLDIRVDCVKKTLNEFIRSGNM